MIDAPGGDDDPVDTGAACDYTAVVSAERATSPDEGRVEDGAGLSRRASRVVTIIGAVELALFGFTFAAVLWASGQSASEFHAKLPAGGLTLERAAQVHARLPAAAAAVGALGCAPGLLYLIGGVGVRRGSRTAALLLAALAVMQVIVLGAVLGMRAVEAVRAGDPPSLTVAVLVLGTPAAVLVYAVAALLRVGRRAASVSRAANADHADE